jgi:hypothetical protein
MQKLENFWAKPHGAISFLLVLTIFQISAVFAADRNWILATNLATLCLLFSVFGLVYALVRCKGHRPFRVVTAIILFAYVLCLAFLAWDFFTHPD